MPVSNVTSHSSKSRALRTTVLHVSPDLEQDDPGRETVALATLTQRSGWRSLIASAGGRLVTEAERAAVRHKRIPLDRRGPFGAWRVRLSLEAMVQKEKPDILHAHGFETLPVACALSRAHKLPLAIDLTQPAAAGNLGKMADLLKQTGAVFRVPSAYMDWELQDKLKIDAARIRLIPPGIDLQWHSAGFVSPERLQKLNNLWRLPENASVALVPMPLKPDLGHRQFLEAMARLKGESLYAVLLGNDRAAPGQRAALEALISQLGLDGKVIMPDHCPDMPAACWLASVIVAPNVAPRGSNVELLAAQAIGRPVIVTDIGANREMVLSGETAWVVPPDNVMALADALREAVRLDTVQRLNLAGLTHDFIAGSFPQTLWFEGMMDIYEKLLTPAPQSRALAAAKVA